MFNEVKILANEMLDFTWPMIVLSVIICIFSRLIYLFLNKKEIVLYDEILKLFFIVYIMCLFQIVTYQDNSYSSANFIPFREMLRYSLGTKLFFKNVFGNVLLFIPFGFFLTKYIKINNISIMFYLTVIVSSSIELIQSLIGRVFDIDDIILNVLGSIVGYLFYKMFKLVYDKIPKILKKEILLNIVSLLLLGGFIWFLVI